MWQAIQYVTTGFTLAAFIAAAIASVLKRQADNKLKAIQSAPEADRPDLVRDVLEFLHVDPSGLTKGQQYNIAVKQIQERAARFRITAIVVVLLALIGGLLSAFAISYAAGQTIDVRPEAMKGEVTVKLTCSENPSRVYTGYITVRSTDGKNANYGEVLGGEAHFPLPYGEYQIRISNQVGTKDDQFSLQVPSVVLTYDCDDYRPKNSPQAISQEPADETRTNSEGGIQTNPQPGTRNKPQPVQTSSEASDAQTSAQPLVDKTWAGIWENAQYISLIPGKPSTTVNREALTLSIEIKSGTVLAGVLSLVEAERDDSTNPWGTVCSAEYRLAIHPVANSRNAMFSGQLSNYFGSCKVNNPVEIQGELLRGTNPTEHIKVLVGDNENIKDLSDLHLVKQPEFP